MKYFLTKLIEKGKVSGTALSRFTGIKNNKYIGLQSFYNGRWVVDPLTDIRPINKKYTIDKNTFIEVPITESMAKSKIEKDKKFDKELEKLTISNDKLEKKFEKLKIEGEKLKKELVNDRKRTQRDN
jgi:ribosome-binding ATPase YchF (GTP1/OBG family)